MTFKFLQMILTTCRYAMCINCLSHIGLVQTGIFTKYTLALNAFCCLLDTFLFVLIASYCQILTQHLGRWFLDIFYLTER
jgi:hypothetical protein